ncbi:uncharacterized protein [Dermacentor albipictus]|uniref:uncharacterized protein n=1 Tax=Dermacentor albipictus TaxID=60249 RepID=UPI0038FCD346
MLHDVTGHAPSAHEATEAEAGRWLNAKPLPESGALVFARNFLPGPPWSAGQVVSPASASSLLVRMPDWAAWQRHADHVRPRLGTWPAPSTATSELQPAGGLAATPVTSCAAPPTSEAASVASGVAPVGPVSSPAPLTRLINPDPPDGVRLVQVAPGVATPRFQGGVLDGGGHRSVTRLGCRHRRPG